MKQTIIKFLKPITKRIDDFNRVDKFVANEKKAHIPEAIKIKKYVQSKDKCKSCGINLEDNQLTPEFHHKDGDNRNNSYNNLVVLCPNCHRKEDLELLELR